MHGGYFVGAGLVGGMLGNLWCNVTGRETCSSKVRRLPAPVVGATLGAFSAWFMTHLYGDPAKMPQRAQAGSLGRPPARS